MLNESDKVDQVDFLKVQQLVDATSKIMSSGPIAISLNVSLALAISSSSLSILFLPGISTDILLPILRIDGSVTPLLSILL